MPAPATTRLIAYVLDMGTTLVLLAARSRFVAPALVSALGGSSFMGRMLYLTVAFLIVLGYWVVFPAVMGATPGKRLFGLRVVPDRNRPLGLDQVLLREIVGHALNGLTLGLGFLRGLSDERQRGFNDRVAGTRLVLLTPPIPGAYRALDLRTVDPDGTLATGRQEAEPVGEPLSAETPQAVGEPAEPRQPPGPAAEPAGKAVEEDTAPAVASPTAAAAPAASPEKPPAHPPASELPPVSPPPPPPREGTLYARPEGETAYERKMRAARGPTVPELAEALRRTAKLVDEGTLMPKVLERKRLDFVASMENVDLGTNPEDAIRIVVSLGRDGVLTTEELGRVRDVLTRRLRG